MGGQLEFPQAWMGNFMFDIKTTEIHGSVIERLDPVHIYNFNTPK